MKFRLEAFALHLCASLAALAFLLGTLYLGWYRWPGWYLADVSRVVLVMIAVDLGVGPLLTFVAAAPTKPRRALARDVAVIVAVQLVALTYGTLSLWNGRPLYYAFSENQLQVIQAYDIDPREWEYARTADLELRPRWCRLPRWIWAPLPQDPKEQAKIIASAVSGGEDVIAMPRYYKSWASGLPELRTQLKRVDDIGYFSSKEKKRLKERMAAAGFSPDQLNAIPLTGRGRPLLAVFDPSSLKLMAFLAAT